MSVEVPGHWPVSGLMQVILKGMFCMISSQNCSVDGRDSGSFDSELVVLG